MLCCAVGVAAVATGAIGWQQFRRFLHWRLNAQSLLAASVMMIAIMLLTGLAVEHVFRHAHAADEQALLTDPGDLPLCRAGSPADRATDIASLQE
jgi:divalent metal cation (Fe/Co/Zn/Cd) transporter